MKAISLWNPWAAFVAHGLKLFETRSWPTDYRGPLVIHASAKWSADLRHVCRSPYIARCLQQLGAEWVLPRPKARVAVPSLPFGAFLGVVNLVTCRPTRDVEAALSRTEAALGNYGPGRFAWALQGAVAFDAPVPGPGLQGLFDPPPGVVELARQILAQNPQTDLDAIWPRATLSPEERGELF